MGESDETSRENKGTTTATYYGLYLNDLYGCIWRLTTPRIRVSVGDVGLENGTDGFDFTAFDLDNESGDLSAGKSDSAGVTKGNSYITHGRLQAGEAGVLMEAMSVAGVDAVGYFEAAALRIVGLQATQTVLAYSKGSNGGRGLLALAYRRKRRWWLRKQELADLGFVGFALTVFEIERGLPSKSIDQFRGKG